MARRSRFFDFLVAMMILALPLGAYAAEPIQIRAEEAFGPQRPAEVPVLDGLNVGKNPYGRPGFGPDGLPPAPGAADYMPVQGDSFAKRSDGQMYNFTITSGTWWLKTGDSPRLLMELRTDMGAYAKPGILADVGVSGEARIRVTAAGKTKWLDEFTSIDVVLSPGQASWTCQDQALGVKVSLSLHQFIDTWGFAWLANVSAPDAGTVTLEWVLDKAKHEADKEQYALFSSHRYTQIYCGLTDGLGKVKDGRISATLDLSANKAQQCRFVCVWGYSDYNRQTVEQAYQRLRFQPYADKEWLEQMKAKWFEHWVGRGLDPETKFRKVQQQPDEAIEQSRAFWRSQRQRMRVDTPDDRFDNVVNATSAFSRMLYEYPAFIHGFKYAKYGKINHGFYGFNAAGMHDEVANSLQFVAGAQDVKGRQRYIMPSFAISDWHEDMDFYFAEQVWWHWRWTGDDTFLATMWPSARRALQHGLDVSDTDGDDIMTGYYEMWNSDGFNVGGYSALTTAMGWSALRAGAQMAAHLDDHNVPQGTWGGAPMLWAKYYNDRMERTRKLYEEKLWHKGVGAWSSAGWNGINRPRPHTCEQNYAIWRGIGAPMQNYMAMRYIRENLHLSDLEEGMTFEFINDWWPIEWSHHYVASGDTCASFHSACAAGDVDGHWPAFKSVTETAYIKHDVKTAHFNSGSMAHQVGNLTMETEPLFLAAVVDGLFGVQPWFGENLLVIKPSPLSHWNEFSFEHQDVTYAFQRSADKISLRVTTPVARRVRAELPVRRTVAKVLLNGATTDYSLKPAVNTARLVAESPAGTVHEFTATLKGEQPKVEGDLLCILDQPNSFTIKGARVVKIHDPQDALTRHEANGNCATLVPARLGKPTVFLELQAGNAIWWEPLDLELAHPWKIVHVYRPGLHDDGNPTILSPVLDEKAKTLSLEIQNNMTKAIDDTAVVTVAGKVMRQNVQIPARTTRKITLSLDSLWDRLSPGSVPVTLKLADHTQETLPVNWKLNPGPALEKHLKPLELASLRNANIAKLFSPATQWRLDYTGAQHGVDWRHPMPLKDERGYVLLSSVMSMYAYGQLPEQWMGDNKIRFSPPPADALQATGLPFLTPQWNDQKANNIIALSCTQPYEQFPSQMVFTLDKPQPLTKLYLLTSNLTKPLKCYYPGAELVAHYTDGSTQVHQMIPPYTMPSAVSSTCPRAFPVKIGTVVGRGTTACDRNMYMSVTDVLLDPSKHLESLTLRCVATETMVGLIAATALTP